MKNFPIYLSLISLLAVTSCNSVEPTTPVTETEVTETESSQEWLLSFDLPDTWVMKEIEDQDGVYLQNTTKVASFSSGREPEDYTEEKYATENVVQITVLHLASDTAIPPAQNYGVTDLEDGFTKVKTCDDITYPECALGGSSSYTYFFVSPTGEKFSFHSSSRTTTVTSADIETIILSAKE